MLSFFIHSTLIIVLTSILGKIYLNIQIRHIKRAVSPDTINNLRGAFHVSQRS